ncbi:MAG TPA: PIN domain-containing protein [Gemmataceae bacterium]|nr:PIN domain-containing protein [Gemmataceae bacterium]
MILVDSSVMIEALRKPDPKLQNLFTTLQPALCGIVVAEVLHGARDAVHYTKLVQALASFPLVSMPDGIWEIVGRNLWSLRSSGVTVPFQDTAIATVAIENYAELWTRDAQFQLIHAVLPKLNLFQEPA